MEDLHPEKYMELHKKLLQEAKSESIRLLRDYADNHIVMSDEPEYADEDWLFARDGDDVPIQLYAYGLNEKGELCFKAWYENSDKDYEDGNWCEFEKYFITDLYCEVYAIIAEHILAPQSNVV